MALKNAVKKNQVLNKPLKRELGKKKGPYLTNIKPTKKETVNKKGN